MCFIKKCIICIIFLFITPYYCMAEPYIGFSIGQASSQKLQEDDVITLDYGFNGGEDLETFRQKTKDISFRIFAGRELMDWVDIEFGYVDLGENSFVAEDTTSTHSNNTSHRNHIEASYNLTGIYIAVMPKIISSSGLEVNLKLGAMSWDASGILKLSGEDTYTNIPPYSFSRKNSLSDNGTDILIGLGISYGIYHLEYERLQVNNSDIDNITLSLKFNLKRR